MCVYMFVCSFILEIIYIWFLYELQHMFILESSWGILQITTHDS